MYAGWKVKVSGGLDIELPVEEADTITVTVSEYDEETGTYTFTAEEGFDTYVWKFEGTDKPALSDEPYSNTNTFTTPNMKSGNYSLPGYYDVTLLATKTVDGVKKYYSYSYQINHKMN